MSTFSLRPLLPNFLPSINALLAALSLPFTVDDPTDLTPSLLLAIFESLINARLPIPQTVRQSRTRDAKSRAMLVLLGVLECDVLRGGTADAEHSVPMSSADDSGLAGTGGVSVDGWVDEIGLGEVDPERLADGGWEETIFVGELLCWLARRKGILPRNRSSGRSLHTRSLYSNHYPYGDGEDEGEGDTADFSTSLLLQRSPSYKARSPRPTSPSPFIDADPDSSTLSHITDVPRHPLVHSPEPSLSASATTGTDLSIRARSLSSRTSVSDHHHSDDPDELDNVSQDTMHAYDPRRMMQDADDDDDRPPIFRPHCIHELEDPSYVQALGGAASNSFASREHISEVEDEPSRDEENDDSCAPPTPTPQRIRLTGWIDHVDTDVELDHFAASRAVHSGARSSRSSSYIYTRTGEPPVSTLRRNAEKIELSPPRHSRPGSLRIPPRVSPSPSPLSPSPPTLASSSSERPTRHVRSSSPPPSPTAHSDPDPAFDVSFSSLNNTSTPAKPRPPRQRSLQTDTTRPEIVADTYIGTDRNKSRGSVGSEMVTGRPRLGRLERSPSYTPSPPSFSTPRSLRNGSSSANSGRSGVVVGVSSGSLTQVSTRKTIPTSMMVTVKSKSPPSSIPPGSTTITNTLLNERARLLTELAALKRARAASGGGTGAGSVGVGTGASGGNRRVGVGV